MIGILYILYSAHWYTMVARNVLILRTEMIPIEVNYDPLLCWTKGSAEICCNENPHRQDVKVKHKTLRPGKP